MLIVVVEFVKRVVVVLAEIDFVMVAFVAMDFVRMEIVAVVDIDFVIVVVGIPPFFRQSGY